jgi:serine/threonine protein kinase
LNIGEVVSGGSIIFLLALCAPFVTRKIKLYRANRLKKRFFEKNHGLLLQKTNFSERMIIPLLDLEKATYNFDRSHEIGVGGHGVVYRGFLGEKVVAIKKSKMVVQREIDGFINEVAILSQINHRHVVKLIGCCLETEVPLLVYEYISNGTLGHHLHVEGATSLSWYKRLKIALDVAQAISYLHSAASIPIYHRDIKSSNILLDDEFKAKVSDFGASRYIQIDQTGENTDVQGTMGYIDPMSQVTGRLTDKSDVFSFGVLLVELLTRKKPSVYRSGDSLFSHFASLLAAGNLDEIIDPQVMQEDNGEAQEVVTLAAACIQLMGEDRPTMREVEMKLERVYNMCVAPDNASRRSNRNQTGTRYIPIERGNIETSRQYTMEEEILLSATYPR